jgi:hypothetical protein
MRHQATSQSAIWKSMTLSDKYNLLAATIRQARDLKRIGIRMQKPTATPQEVEQELARIWLHARP